MLEEIYSGQKKVLSSNVILDFLTVNLWNLEYFMNCPLKAFIVMNGFLASLIIPLLIVDTFVKPINGKGPTQGGGTPEKKTSPQKNPSPLKDKEFKEVRKVKFE